MNEILEPVHEYAVGITMMQTCKFGAPLRMSLTCSVGAAPSIAGAAAAADVLALAPDDCAVDGMAKDEDESP